jgi:hypothetical protein
MQGEVFSHRPQEKSEIISHGGFILSPSNDKDLARRALDSE